LRARRRALRLGHEALFTQETKWVLVFIDEEPRERLIEQLAARHPQQGGEGEVGLNDRPGPTHGAAAHRGAIVEVDVVRPRIFQPLMRATQRLVLQLQLEVARAQLVHHRARGVERQCSQMLRRSSAFCLATRAVVDQAPSDFRGIAHGLGCVQAKTRKPDPARQMLPPLRRATKGKISSTSPRTSPTSSSRHSLRAEPGSGGELRGAKLAGGAPDESALLSLLYLPSGLVRIDLNDASVIPVTVRVRRVAIDGARWLMKSTRSTSRDSARE
jgi:hypothetical protein